MATNVKIVLDTRHMKEDGSYPLYLRIIHNRKPTNIHLGYWIKEEDWDDTSQQIKRSCKLVSNVNKLNNELAKRKTDAFDIINDLSDKKLLDTISVNELKDKILNVEIKVSFQSFGQKIIDELISTNRIGTADFYRDTLNFVKNHSRGRDLSFNEIEYKFLKSLETSHLRKGQSWNGLAVYMRGIRAIFNRAIKENVATQDNYPFKTYKIRNEKTQKRAIGKEWIDKIWELVLPEQSRLWHARNYFIFSFNVRGMNFYDMAKLRIQHIANGRIEYQRSKTHKPLSVKITERAAEILDYYTFRKSVGDYVFPIIKRKSQVEMHRDIENGRSTYNDCLHEIAEMCGITTNLTSYVSRHSWASRAKKKGADIYEISESLGHSDIGVTQVYLESLDYTDLDNLNEMITN
ncbi:MAG: site-specific integrase [Bacteroidia bacterium]|nr:site-specific integrase [Bacteroidia bacterium]